MEKSVTFVVIFLQPVSTRSVQVALHSAVERMMSTTLDPSGSSRPNDVMGVNSGANSAGVTPVLDDNQHIVVVHNLVAVQIGRLGCGRDRTVG
jgi:hypothetical protein